MSLPERASWSWWWRRHIGIANVGTGAAAGAELEQPASAAVILAGEEVTAHLSTNESKDRRLHIVALHGYERNQSVVSGTL